ncbi:tetratricopeptide repeat protein [Glacieibacterium sp.]|uniref:tetratricopeptide repeat protein n=1 Tax=Glacieibacterium sp. TaxID=2860237 RepID=UPI003B00BB1E
MKAILTVLLLCAAGPAAASAAIIGSGYGHDCYIAARLGHGGRGGLEACNKAIELEAQSHQERAATFVNRGIVRMQSNELVGAIADFDAAIRARPETAEAYINKGIAVFHLGGRDHDAIQLLTQGIERSPEQPEVAYYVRGIANEQIGEMRNAYEDYSRAAALKPGWAEPISQLQRFSVQRRSAGLAA